MQVNKGELLSLVGGGALSAPLAYLQLTYLLLGRGERAAGAQEEPRPTLIRPSVRS